MKKQLLAFCKYFTKGELCLWSASVSAVALSFFLFDRNNYGIFFASLLGVTAILFNAKGNPIGQGLMLVFSLFYTVISHSLAYYGEMITYLGMTAPMALFALIAWLRHPYQGKRSQVKVNHIAKREIAIMFLITAAVTVLFYFILRAFDTAKLILSTLSVATSFVAVYLTFRRSPYFSLAYAANDIVLILLWSLASREDLSYLSVVVCFLAFLANDIYAYISWRRMRARQENGL